VLAETKASYAYVRVTYSNDKESQREKFILVVWIGPGCKVMRKAKVSACWVSLRSLWRAGNVFIFPIVKAHVVATACAHTAFHC